MRLTEQSKRLEERLKYAVENVYNKAEEKIFDVLNPIVTSQQEGQGKVEASLENIKEKISEFGSLIKNMNEALYELQELRDVASAEGNGSMIKGITKTVLKTFEKDTIPSFSTMFASQKEFKIKNELDKAQYFTVLAQIDLNAKNMQCLESQTRNELRKLVSEDLFND